MFRDKMNNTIRHYILYPLNLVYIHLNNFYFIYLIIDIIEKLSIFQYQIVFDINLIKYYYIYNENNKKVRYLKE